MNIAGHELGIGHPCFIAAELSANHNGDFGRAVAILEAAAKAGATGFKMQAFTLEEILALRGDGQAPAPWDAYTKHELYTKALTPASWFPHLFDTARGLGLVPFASVFGSDSLAMLEALDCPAYKIAKPERQCEWLIREVVKTAKPVLISTARWDELYVPRDGNGNFPTTVERVYCPDGYPTRKLKLSELRTCEDWLIGLSCHHPNPLVGPVAVSLGAHYLEFHLTLDDGVPTLDDCVNLTSSQFTEMVRLTRAAEAML